MKTWCVLFLASEPSKSLSFLFGSPVLNLVFIFSVLFAVKYVVKKIETGKQRELASGKYKLVDSVLTKTEMKFYKVLTGVVPQNVQILIKPRLADFVKTKARNDHASFNRIKAKHVDFLLCDKITLAPLLAIELDDSSHQRPKTRKRDAFVNALYGDIGLPIHRVTVSGKYDTNSLASSICDAVEVTPPPLPASAV